MSERSGSRLLEVRDLRKYFPIHKGVFASHHGDVKAVDGVDVAVLSDHDA